MVRGVFGCEEASEAECHLPYVDGAASCADHPIGHGEWCQSHCHDERKRQGDEWLSCEDGMVHGGFWCEESVDADALERVAGEACKGACVGACAGACFEEECADDGSCEELADKSKKKRKKECTDEETAARCPVTCGVCARGSTAHPASTRVRSTARPCASTLRSPRSLRSPSSLRSRSPRSRSLARTSWTIAGSSCGRTRSSARRTGG